MKRYTRTRTELRTDDGATWSVNVYMTVDTDPTMMEQIIESLRKYPYLTKGTMAIVADGTYVKLLQKDHYKIREMVYRWDDFDGVAKSNYAAEVLSPSVSQVLQLMQDNEVLFLFPKRAGHRPIRVQCVKRSDYAEYTVYRDEEYLVPSSVSIFRSGDIDEVAALISIIMREVL